MIDETHDPKLRSWVESANGHAEFPIQNLPFGIFASANGDKRAGVAIGDKILDLRAAAKAKLISGPAAQTLSADTLNALLALPSNDRMALRRALSKLLSDEGQRAAVEPHLHNADTCAPHLPAHIGDYTDFYVGIHHANNVGKQFRPDNPLLPNYKYVPIGYHGRASSVRVSGDALVRPNGQRKGPNDDAPSFGPARRLDYELELGVWIGAGNDLGAPFPIADANDHIAGFCLLNDWSARDLQAWEYQPLGPFLAKSFHTTVSPWIVTIEALAPFRTAQAKRPDGDPQPLPYLWNDNDQAHGAYALELGAALTTAKMREAKAAPFTLTKTHAAHMYWTFAQIVTHHASNGCNLQPGDLLGSGTISAPQAEGYASLLELTGNGATPLDLPNGETRTFLEDGDEIILTAHAHAKDAVSIGFGRCAAIVKPAPQIR